MSLVETGEIGVVVIGRNEGERLQRCLRSVRDRASCIVYVDSGSTDGSVEHARAVGTEVVELDPSVPFTMARGRNEGVKRLQERWKALRYVQFVDGDCEVREGWLDRAFETLESDETLAVVFGRRRERHPEASVYNLLCDIEWDVPVGEADSCGGDAMMRIDALGQVGAYDARLIAGEEPELCVRLRKHGWRIRRIDAEMTLHDAAMHRLGQWWTRSTRTGYSFAEGVVMHGAPPWRHRVRELRSVALWGVALPAVLLVSLGATPWFVPARVALAVGIALYGWLALRIYRHGRSTGERPARALIYSAFTLMSKLPQGVGAAKYALLALAGRRSDLIEYK